MICFVAPYLVLAAPGGFWWTAIASGGDRGLQSGGNRADGAWFGSGDAGWLSESALVCLDGAHADGCPVAPFAVLGREYCRKWFAHNDDGGEWAVQFGDRPGDLWWAWWSAVGSPTPWATKALPAPGWLGGDYRHGGGGHADVAAHSQLAAGQP